MAASDDEDTLASFGTPFEPLEEDAPRKKAVPIHEQIVTDAEGRRRFHGAFTGGFSAGYFNSVGTKEGWQPSTFVSSRSKKFEQRAQRPEDFMDDEDMGEFGIAPRRITTKEEFLSQKSELQRKRVIGSEVSEGIIPGGPLLEDLVVPVKMSVGVELLKKMGWKEGQGVGPRERRTKKKVYGCSLPPSSSTSETATGNDDEEEDIFAVGLLFAPKDVDVFTFTPKDDKHGLGYKGLDPSTALLGRDDWLGIDPVSSRVGRKGVTGEAFGVGAFEETDDNIYAEDHLSNYDVELGSDTSTGLHGWTGPQKENARGGALSIFTAKSKAMDAMKPFPPPVVPRSFDYTHKFSGDSKTEPKSSEEAAPKRKILTASDRGEMLGEEPLPAPPKSVFEYLSEDDKKRVLSASKDKTAAVKNSSAINSEVMSSSASDSRRDSRFSSRWSGHSSFKPFAKDSAKQARYEEFLKLSQGEKLSEQANESYREHFSSRWSGHSSFKPFAKDSAKQARYEEFLKLSQGEKLSEQANESGLTEWEREREKEEFARSAALYRPLNSTMAARFTTAKLPDDHRTVYEEVPAQQSSDTSDQTKAAKMKMFGKLTRDSFEWHPENTLCKRFNIPNPYPGSRIVGVPKVRKPKFTLGDFIVPQEPRALTYEHSSTSDDDNKSEKFGTISKSVGGPTPSDSKLGSSELPTKAFVAQSETTSISNMGEGHANSQPNESKEDTTKETQNEEAAPKRPSMDLFKAIFADSSSDESEASDEDEDGKEETKTEGLLIQTSEEKPPEEASSSDIVVRTKESNLTSRFTSNNENLNQGLFSKPNERDEDKPIEVQAVVTKSTESKKVDSSPEIYGPVLPRSSHHLSSSHSFSREKSSMDTTQSKEDSERSKKRKDKRKDTKKRYSDSSDSEEEHRSKHKHKHKEKKKHKHKHKSKHRDEEKERLDKKAKGNDVSKGDDVTSQSSEQASVSDDKQILSKLKNLQNLKAGKRMRAVDFM